MKLYKKPLDIPIYLKLINFLDAVHLIYDLSSPSFSVEICCYHCYDVKIKINGSSFTCFLQ